MNICNPLNILKYLPHNANYVVFLYYKAQSFNLAAVLRASGHDIDPGGIDTAVAQNIRQFSNILFNTVESPGKELSQIVRKYLTLFNPGILTKLLHLPPDAAAVKRLAVFADKNRTGFDAMAFGVIQKHTF